MDSQLTECPVCFEEVSNVLTPCKQCHIELCLDCVLKLTEDHVFNCPQCRKLRVPSSAVERPSSSSSNVGGQGSSSTGVEKVRLNVADHVVVYVCYCHIQYQSNQTVKVFNDVYADCQTIYEFHGNEHHKEFRVLTLGGRQKISEINMSHSGVVIITSSDLLYSELKVWGCHASYLEIRDFHGVDHLHCVLVGDSHVFAPKQDDIHVPVSSVYARVEERAGISGLRCLNTLEVNQSGSGHVSFFKGPTCDVVVQGSVHFPLD